MPRKRHSAEEIVAKLRQVDVLLAQGQTGADVARVLGVTETTYYRWRSEPSILSPDLELAKRYLLKCNPKRTSRFDCVRSVRNLVLQVAGDCGELASSERRLHTKLERRGGRRPSWPFIFQHGLSPLRRDYKQHDFAQHKGSDPCIQ
jgi:hypothetical protein